MQSSSSSTAAVDSSLAFRLEWTGRSHLNFSPCLQQSLGLSIIIPIYDDATHDTVLGHIRLGHMVAVIPTQVVGSVPPPLYSVHTSSQSQERHTRQAGRGGRKGSTLMSKQEGKSKGSKSSSSIQGLLLRSVLGLYVGRRGLDGVEQEEEARKWVLYSR